MSIHTQVSQDPPTVTISISGQFNAMLHREFRDAYKGRLENPTKGHYIVDLGKTEYMDSAALGMLLLLHEYAGGKSARVTIRNANQFIRDVLEIAKFDKMFDIV
ncbi:MAG: STAS domain-containing protein [Gammaproteobacteria bacterium]|nr:STAS domain-containing protein [Gammaproteobacteria bacterium]